MWRQGAAIGKKPRVAGFSSVLRPEGSELGRARGGTDGLDGELLLLPAWKPTNTSIPLYPPLQPEMLYRARTGEVGKAVLIFVQISPNILCLCANIPEDSLNAITSYLKLEPFQHPQKNSSSQFCAKESQIISAVAVMQF